MEDSTFCSDAAVDDGSDAVAAPEPSAAAGDADDCVQSGDGGDSAQEIYDDSAAATGQLSESDAGQAAADPPPADTSMPDASEGADGGAPESNPEEDTRKLFVGGLAPESTRDDVQQYFSKFGEVAQCIVKTDVFTGRSRGFGFVVFKEPASVEKTLAVPVHELHGKYIDPKRANPKIGKAKEPVLKVFVGGIDPSTTREELIEYFTKFGPVVSMDLPTLKKTEERRGFIFVTFETEEAVSKCCEDPRQTILGRECDVKRATPKQEYQKQQQTAERGGASGGYGYAGSRGSRGAPTRGVGGSSRGGSYYGQPPSGGSGSGYYRGGRGGGYSAGYGGQGYAAASGGRAGYGASGGYGPSGDAGYGGGAGRSYGGAGASGGYGAGYGTSGGGRGAGGYGSASTNNSYGSYQYGDQGYNGSGYDGYGGGATGGGSAGGGYGGSYQGGADYGGPGAGKMRARPRGAAAGSYGYQPY